MQNPTRRTFLIASTLTTLTAALRAQHNPCCGPITPAGNRLAATLDSMNVESLWLANEHINWETGQPDRGANYEGPGNHTHCSAFAAAAAKKLGIYLLRPPEHGQQLLSNAQAEWLPSPEAKKAGWRPIHDMHQAQHLANEGNLVLVIFENPDKHLPATSPSSAPARNPLAPSKKTAPKPSRQASTITTRSTSASASKTTPAPGPMASATTPTPSNNLCLSGLSLWFVIPEGNLLSYPAKTGVPHP